MVSTAVPGARSAHTVTGVPGGHVLVGGMVPTKRGEVCSGEVFAANDAQREWRAVRCEGGPKVFAHAAAVVGREQLYLAVFGGMVNQQQWSQRMHLLPLGAGASKIEVQCRLREETLAWEVVGSSETSPSPCARWGHTLVTHPDTHDAVLFGGNGDRNRGTLCDTWVFCHRTRTWARKETAGDQPETRRRHSACVYESAMYIFGGRTAEGVHHSDLHALCLATWTWRAVDLAWGVKPSPRGGHAAWITPEGVLVVYGGSSGVQPDDDTGYGVASDVYAVDLTAPDAQQRQWVAVRDDLPKRSMMAAYVVNGALCVHGGRDSGRSYGDVVTLDDVPLTPALLEARAAAAAAGSPTAGADASAADAAAPPPPKERKRSWFGRSGNAQGGAHGGKAGGANSSFGSTISSALSGSFANSSMSVANANSFTIYEDSPSPDHSPTADRSPTVVKAMKNLFGGKRARAADIHVDPAAPADAAAAPAPPDSPFSSFAKSRMSTTRLAQLDPNHAAAGAGRPDFMKAAAAAGMPLKPAGDAFVLSPVVASPLPAVF